MYQIVKIGLENEMDLILAHKRCMKLAEMCGLSLSSQTTFATAVSEIARCAISYGNHSYLELGIRALKGGRKEMCGLIADSVDIFRTNTEALGYAKRLLGNVQVTKGADGIEVSITHHIPFSGTISPQRINAFIHYFKTEPPLSPYDEIRKRNIQLIELSTKLTESEAQYKMLTDTLPLMMFSINNRGEVTFSNKGLKDFFGTPVSTGKIMWQSILHPEDYHKLLNEWEKAQQNKTMFRGQARLQNRDKYIWHLISMVPNKNDNEVVLSWIGFFVDIHAQKMIEETLKDNRELKDAQKKLEQYRDRLETKIKELNTSNHDLEQFAYIASHDLQEPLRKIKTFCALLEKDLDLNERSKYYFDKVTTSADRMSVLISNVLDYSRLSRAESAKKPVDLNEIIGLVRTDFELLIQEKKARINYSDLPVINGVSQQLSQLFYNLIGNSLKFSDKEPVISISAGIVPASVIKSVAQLNHYKSYHEVILKDNGIGFDQQYGKKIFTIFQRLNSGQSYSGTGIGLALCKKIVENHQGIIQAHGEPGIGATFKIYFPVES